MSKVRKTFGRLIREVRELRKESQGAIARLAGIPASHLSRLENDHHDPRLSLALRLLRILAIDPEYLGEIGAAA
jgi:transcriptional regulator with XRE-family HTH domain